MNEAGHDGIIVKAKLLRLVRPRCGLVLVGEDGKVVKDKSDKEHPITRGFVCWRVLLIAGHLNHPGLINFPFKRVAESCVLSTDLKTKRI